MGVSSLCCFCIAKAEESPCTENDRVAELEMEGAEGASTSGRMQYIAKAEESPPTVVDVVAGLEATTTVGASTAGRTEYYSARCEAMMRSRGEFTDDIEFEIAFSKSHWSEVSRLEVAPQSAEEEELNRENREVCKQMREQYPDFFLDGLDDYVPGRMIARGGQAKVYEVVGDSDLLLKVFERGTSLQALKQSWPLPVLKEDVTHCIYYAGMLGDGRFAFVMNRYWGDLRKLIDQAMQEKNAEGMQGPPFPYKGWEEAPGWTFHPVDFMLGIAKHMEDIHKEGISHRDLKASNVLVPTNFTNFLSPANRNLTSVTDFECSIGVLGTGYWRAPEILAAPGNTSSFTSEQWKKANVYSYGMTCFEIVTGRIPFDGELENTIADRQLVIEGKRPQLPSDLDDAVKDLITKCWAPSPNLRPTFFEIVKMVDTISERQCKFRLFGIGIELPPQYRLATVQEVEEFTFALAKATSMRRIANLVDGSVDGYLLGLKIRMEKRSNATHKLGRLHH